MKEKPHGEVPAGDGCERPESVRQQDNNILDGCPSVFLLLGCFLCRCCFLRAFLPQYHSVWACQTHGIGLNDFLPLCDSVSLIPLKCLFSTVKNCFTKLLHPDLETTKLTHFRDMMWNQSAVNNIIVVNILRHDVSILAHRNPSCVLVFWPETVAPPEVQLVLALIRFVWHAQTAGVCLHWYCPAQSALSVSHSAS